MKKGKNRKTKPYLKREEQENKTLYKKGRTGKQNPMRKSGRKKRKKKKKGKKKGKKNKNKKHRAMFK